MPTAEQFAALQAENQMLRQHLTLLTEQNSLLQSQLAAALARFDQLENPPKDPPAFVKPNAPKHDPKPRRKRDPKHNRARRLEIPTRIEQHLLERCPDCHQRLRGGSLARRRQSIDLPEPQPVDVIEHLVG